MMKFVVLAVLVAVAAAEMDLDVLIPLIPSQSRLLDVNLGDLPMQNPDLFQGDILGYEPGDRNVIPQTQLRWTGAKIPYVIDSSVSFYTNLIQQAMGNYHQTTCVRFIPRTHESNYIKLFAGQGCYSNVGMIGGQQPVSLGQGCMFKGTIVHELGHALGFYHEQNRSDRDDYLIIYYENIKSGMADQFAKLLPHQNLLLTPFDYDSIMCYGNTAFSKDGRSKTMVAKNGVILRETYDKAGLTNSDVTRVKKMYNC